MGEKTIEKIRSSRPETTRQLWGEEFQIMLKTEKWTSPRTEVDDPLYWVPLIARLHGLRSEEVLQLKPQNIRRDDDVWFFDIERGTGQSVKSENGRRMVPLHDQIIELGFLELVARQSRLGKTRIFDQIARSKSSKLSYTANFTKKFTYYRKSRNIYDARQDLHGLRTTFNSKCVGNAVPDTARRYLMGHRNTDVGIVNYLPEGFPLKRLKQYVDADRIDLSMVRRLLDCPKDRRKGLRLISHEGVAISAR